MAIRFLHRIPISTNTRAHINHQYLHYLAKKRKTIEHAFSNKSNNETLKKTMSFIKHNDDYATYAETPEENETKTNVDDIISDALLLDYLLLDLASVWEQLRYKNTLASLELLCMAWAYRCNDIFDACFILLKDYWTRYRYHFSILFGINLLTFLSLSFLLDTEVEFETIANLLLDILGNWTQVNLSTRISLCNFIKSMLTLCDYEDYEIDTTVTFGPIMSKLLYAAGSFVISYFNCINHLTQTLFEGVEKNSSVKEAILNIITYYCQSFGSAEIIDSILQHVQKR